MSERKKRELSRLRRLLSAYAAYAATLSSALGSLGPILRLRVSPLGALIGYGASTARTLQSRVLVAIVGAPLARGGRRSRRPRGEVDEPGQDLRAERALDAAGSQGVDYAPGTEGDEVVLDSPLYRVTISGALPSMAIARQTAFAETSRMSLALGRVVEGRAPNLTDWTRSSIEGGLYGSLRIQPSRSGPFPPGTAVENAETVFEQAYPIPPEKQTSFTDEPQTEKDAGLAIGDLPLAPGESASAVPTGQDLTSRYDLPLPGAAHAEGSSTQFTVRSRSLAAGNAFLSAASWIALSMSRYAQAPAMLTAEASRTDLQPAFTVRAWAAERLSASDIGTISGPAAIESGQLLGLPLDTQGLQGTQFSGGAVASQSQSGSLREPDPSTVAGASFDRDGEASRAAPPLIPSDADPLLPSGYGGAERYAVPGGYLYSASEALAAVIGSRLSMGLRALLLSSTAGTEFVPHAPPTPGSLLVEPGSTGAPGTAFSPLDAVVAASSLVASLGLWSLAAAASPGRGRPSLLSPSSPEGAPGASLGMDPTHDGGPAVGSGGPEPPGALQRSEPAKGTASSQGIEYSPSELDGRQSDLRDRPEVAGAALSPVPQPLGVRWALLVAAALQAGQSFYGYEPPAASGLPAIRSAVKVQSVPSRSPSGASPGRPSAFGIVGHAGRSPAAPRFQSTEAEELAKRDLQSRYGDEESPRGPLPFAPSQTSERAPFFETEENVQALPPSQGLLSPAAQPVSRWTTDTLGTVASLTSILALSYLSVRLTIPRFAEPEAAPTAAGVAGAIMSASASGLPSRGTRVTESLEGVTAAGSLTNSSPGASPAHFERQEAGGAPGMTLGMGENRQIEPSRSLLGASDGLNDGRLPQTVGLAALPGQAVGLTAFAQALSSAVFLSLAAARIIGGRARGPSFSAAPRRTSPQSTDLEGSGDLVLAASGSPSLPEGQARTIRPALESTGLTFFGLAALASIIPAVALLPYASYKGRPVSPARRQQQTPKPVRAPAPRPSDPTGEVTRTGSPGQKTTLETELETIDEDRMIIRALEESAEDIEAPATPAAEEDGTAELRRKIEKILEEELRRSGFQV